jgi:hypothetical protein
MAGTSQEETAAYFNDIVRPALVRFQTGLMQALKGPDLEGAGIAVVAALTFIKNMKWDNSYMAPLEEALDIIESRITPESFPYFKRAEKVVCNIDDFRKKPPPPIDEFRREDYVSRKDVNRIIAVVAIDLQMLCKVPLPKALGNVVGHDPIAAGRMEHFRENLRGTRNGPKRKFYDEVAKSFKDMPRKQAALSALLLYQWRIGAADAERAVTKVMMKMLKP